MKKKHLREEKVKEGLTSLLYKVVKEDLSDEVISK